MKGGRLAQQLLNSIAGNVVRLRNVAGLTQEQLADLAGLHVTYLRRVEAASRNISIEVLASLSTGLEVDSRELLRPAQKPSRRPGRPPRATAARDNSQD